MLDTFVTQNRDAIIAKARARGSLRLISKLGEERVDGVPMFLDQLVDALRRERSHDRVDHDEIGKAATRNGQDLLQRGLTIGQVVHDYGDICQSITSLAIAQGAPISGEEFRTLNLCLDDAIAEAVTEFSRRNNLAIEARGVERLGFLAHELRNLLNTATLSFEMIKSGRVGAGGSTGQLHSRSLMNLRDLVERSLAEVRLDAGIERLDPVSVAALLEEVEVGAAIEAQRVGLHLTMISVDPAVTVVGDRPILAAALSNLLQNAFKFTRRHSTVSLRVHLEGDHVLFDVEDECGGLPPGFGVPLGPSGFPPGFPPGFPQGEAEELFRPFEQRGADRSGLGLGLSICAKAAKANGGELRVRDLPGKGCVFTLDLPRVHASSVE